MKHWVLFLYFFTSCNTSPVREPVVETTLGMVKGKLDYSKSGRPFHFFKRIPYAKPPIGELRFKAPEEPAKWKEVLNAQEEAPHCMQKNYLFKNPKVEGSEDCLFLNVYTPKLKIRDNPDGAINADNETLPVMVFIHWGGFFAGYSSADYLGPEYFMDKDIVLVTFNYRLGVLGFFSTNDDASPGNYGLKDQLAVLKWVQKNINYFGGDNGSVTLFGQSAGAASVNFHMYNDESRKLFHRGISESGSSLALWAQPQGETQILAAQGQGKIMRCIDINNTTLLVECLRRADATVLVNSADHFKIFSVDPLNVFMPSIEKKTTLNPNPFLTKSPASYIRDEDFGKIPWIVGVVNDEGLLRAEPIIRQHDLRFLLNQNFVQIMPNILALFMSAPKEHVQDLWKRVSKYYFAGRTIIDENDTSMLKGIIDVYTDRSFVYSTYQAVKFHYLKGHKDIWFYNFNYQGQHSYGDIFAATDENILNFDWGVSHCDELLYLFNTPALFDGGLKNHNDIIIKESLIEMWTNFAIHGDPTPQNDVSKLPDWRRIDNSTNSSDPKKLYYLNFEGHHGDAFPPKIDMKYGFYNDRLKFWEETALLENIPELNETVFED